MQIKALVFLILLVIAVLAPAVQGSESFYTIRMEDPDAVYLTKDDFPVHSDSAGDDSLALQMAIDKVAASNSGGILYIPEGTYRISKTVYVWSGIRLIGYGKNRPLFLLSRSTPGYQEGEDKYMLFFSGSRGPDGGSPRDGGAGTFYSAITNIDIRIETGNPAAVGIRFHVAQHSFVSHMDFHLGSARAGLHDIGNEVEDLHFHGGQYGIITARAAPGWPILAIDCTFEGQSKAALKVEQSGLAIVRPSIKDVPVVAEIVPDQSDQLWISDGSFENVSGPAIIISNGKNPRCQVNLENVACRNVPVIAKFRETGKEIPVKSSKYNIDRFSHGLHIESLGVNREIRSSVETRDLDRMPAAVPSDIPRLPSQDTWVNVNDLGIRGDGKTDNTAALRKAIAEHSTLFFPMGLYNVSNTLKLRPDTVLIGFHPSRTVINLPDNSPEYQDAGRARSLIEAPGGGKNIISGIGVYTGAVNASAVAIKWMAGAESMVNDVRLHGGHGTRLDTGGRDWWKSRETWNSQAASLWVTEGGGGTFKDIWTPNVFAKSGMLITDTDTGGRLYAMSSEHHVKNEVIIKNASNWHFYALQFEEEREEGPEALPLEIDNSSNITFSNTLFYRVVSCFVPFPNAIKITNSSNIRFRNLHSYSNSRVAFDNSLYAPDFDIQIRDPEYAVLDYSGDAPPQVPQPASVVLESGAKVEKLADGFLNIAGAAVNSKGELYFTDARRLGIYRWVEDKKKTELVREIPERPMVLAFDKADNLMVIAYEGDGTVLAFKPEKKDSRVQRLLPQPAEPRPGKRAYLPVNRWAWISDKDFIEKETARRPFHYLSPDNTVFIPASDDFKTGATWWRIKVADLIRSFRLAPAVPGRPFYISNEAESNTFAFDVGSDGTLSDARLFAEEGGESLAVDDSGNVYLAAGNIFVFDPSGRIVDTVKTPQRPISIVFGGEDRRTLFITSRDSLYSVRIR